MESLVLYGRVVYRSTSSGYWGRGQFLSVSGEGAEQYTHNTVMSDLFVMG